MSQYLKVIVVFCCLLSLSSAQDTSAPEAVDAQLRFVLAKWQTLMENLPPLRATYTTELRQAGSTYNHTYDITLHKGDYLIRQVQLPESLDDWVLVQHSSSEDRMEYLYAKGSGEEMQYRGDVYLYKEMFPYHPPNPFQTLPLDSVRSISLAWRVSEVARDGSVVTATFVSAGAAANSGRQTILSFEPSHVQLLLYRTVWPDGVGGTITYQYDDDEFPYLPSHIEPDGFSVQETFTVDYSRLEDDPDDLYIRFPEGTKLAVHRSGEEFTEVMMGKTGIFSSSFVAVAEELKGNIAAIITIRLLGRRVEDSDLAPGRLQLGSLRDIHGFLKRRGIETVLSVMTDKDLNQVTKPAIVVGYPKGKPQFCVIAGPPDDLHVYYTDEGTKSPLDEEARLNLNWRGGVCLFPGEVYGEVEADANATDETFSLSQSEFFVDKEQVGAGDKELRFSCIVTAPKSYTPDAPALGIHLQDHYLSLRKGTQAVSLPVEYTPVRGLGLVNKFEFRFSIRTEFLMRSISNWRKNSRVFSLRDGDRFLGPITVHTNALSSIGQIPRFAVLEFERPTAGAASHALFELPSGFEMKSSEIETEGALRAVRSDRGTIVAAVSPELGEGYHAASVLLNLAWENIEVPVRIWLFMHVR